MKSFRFNKCNLEITYEGSDAGFRINKYTTRTVHPDNFNLIQQEQEDYLEQQATDKYNIAGFGDFYVDRKGVGFSIDYKFIKVKVLGFSVK
ncbi:MAG: hypothetical protein VX642_15880 [Bdellovibrionota bacterium]|nr:hypothetical protein [Bdellovibrionota bacterium]